MSGEDVKFSVGMSGTKEIIADFGKMTAEVQKFSAAVKSSTTFMSPSFYPKTSGIGGGREFSAKPPEYMYSKDFTSVAAFSEKMRKMNWDWLPKNDFSFQIPQNSPRHYPQLPNLDKLMGDFSPILSKTKSAADGLCYDYVARNKRIGDKILMQSFPTDDASVQGHFAIKRGDNIMEFMPGLGERIMSSAKYSQTLDNKTGEQIFGASNLFTEINDFAQRLKSSGNDNPEKINLERLLNGFNPITSVTYPKIPVPKEEADWFEKQYSEEEKFYNKKFAFEENERNQYAEADEKRRKHEATERKRTDREARGSLLFFGLGVMFAGMALEKAAKGFLQPALEASGIMEVFGAALTLLFLPAALMLLPIALLFLEWVNNLTAAQKELIGTFMLVVLGVGMLMAVVGQTATFISSMMQAPKVLDAATKFFTDLTSGSVATKLGELTTKLADFTKTPIGFTLAAATLVLTTLYVGSLIYKNWLEDDPTVSQDLKDAVNAGRDMSKTYLGAASPVGEVTVEMGGTAAITAEKVNQGTDLLWSKILKYFNLPEMPQSPYVMNPIEAGDVTGAYKLAHYLSLLLPENFAPVTNVYVNVDKDGNITKRDETLYPPSKNSQIEKAATKG